MVWLCILLLYLKIPFADIYPSVLDFIIDLLGLSWLLQTSTLNNAWWYMTVSLITCLGGGVSIVSFIGILYAVISYFSGKAVSGWASMICVICALGGIQLISLGVIGQYIGKIYLETKHRPRYIISERTGGVQK